MRTCAIIGTGYWGSILTPYVEKFFNVKYKCNSKSDLNDVWNDSEVECVFIISPIETHYELCRDALLHKKHVFVEKPITETVAEAKELKWLAEKNNVRLFVDYVEMYAPSRLIMKKYINEIGKITYIDGSTRHLGRFMNHDVYHLLASHQLSLLSLFVDLNTLSYMKYNHLHHNNLCTTGTIKFGNETVHGKMDISTNWPGKEMKFTLYGDKGTIQFDARGENTVTVTGYSKKFKALPPELTEWQKVFKCDERNNLHYSVEYFKEMVDDYTLPSNIDVAIKITDIISRNPECY